MRRTHRVALSLAVSSSLASCQFISGIASFSEGEGAQGGGASGGGATGGGGSGGIAGAGGLGGTGGIGGVGAAGGAGGSGGSGGGGPVTVCEVNASTRMALGDTDVFVAANAELFACPLTGGAPTPVVTAPASIAELATVGGRVFFSAGVPRELFVVDAGMPASITFAGSTQVTHVASGASKLYVSRAANVFEIDPAAPFDPTPTVVATSSTSISALAADDATHGVYAANGLVHRFGDPTTAFITPAGKGGATEVAANGSYGFATGLGATLHSNAFAMNDADSIMGGQFSLLRVHPSDDERIYCVMGGAVRGYTPAGVALSSVPFANVDDLAIGEDAAYVLAQDLVTRVDL